jgi:hypothetical protein
MVSVWRTHTGGVDLGRNRMAQTFVSVTNKGFPGDEDETLQHALDSTEGFAFVLAGLKALLEHNIQLNLVPDPFPDGLGQR